MNPIRLPDIFLRLEEGRLLVLYFQTAQNIIRYFIRGVMFLLVAAMPWPGNNAGKPVRPGQAGKGPGIVLRIRGTHGCKVALVCRKLRKQFCNYGNNAIFHKQTRKRLKGLRWMLKQRAANSLRWQ
jgi:hypothetical protein